MMDIDACAPINKYTFIFINTWTIYKNWSPNKLYREYPSNSSILYQLKLITTRTNSLNTNFKSTYRN